MTLSERLSEDMKTAMKAQDASLLSTLRMLKSALQNQAIALGHELSDTEVMSVFEKQAKQRRDSIDQYRAGNREDLAAVEQSELAVIEAYLPEKLDKAAVATLVDAAIAETGATAISDMGKVMKLVMEKAAGAAEARLVSEITKEKLA